MRSTLTVNIFASSNWAHLPALLHPLILARSELRVGVRIIIRTSRAGKKYLKDKFAGESNLKIETVDSYWMKALRTYVSRSPIVVKMDDDIFMSRESWSTFIKEAIDIGDNEVLSPVISTGVPSVELFLRHYLLDDEARAVRELMKAVRFPNSLWGADYSSLNGSYATGFSNFLNSVEALNTEFKGIHPVRLDNNSQAALLGLAFKALDRGLLTQGEKNVIISSYFCNNVFALTRRAGLQIVTRTLLGRYSFDGYDELALNGFLRSGGMHVVSIRSLAIHPSYNSASDYQELRSEFFKRVSEMPLTP